MVYVQIGKYVCTYVCEILRFKVDINSKIRQGFAIRYSKWPSVGQKFNLIIGCTQEAYVS